MATEVKAPVTGTVWKVDCSVGDSVEEDDVLLILESMKMEIPVEAPDDGTITEIRVKEKDPVDEGAVVVVLEEA